MEEGAEFAAGFFGLCGKGQQGHKRAGLEVAPYTWRRMGTIELGTTHMLPAFWGEFYAVVWDGLVDVGMFYWAGQCLLARDFSMRRGVKLHGSDRKG